MGRFRGAVVGLVVFVLASAVAVASAGASRDGVPAAKTTSNWRVGDCYSDANVDFDEVVLSSKVACTKSHEVQIVGGEKLSPALASAGLASLTTTNSAARQSLVAFANIACSPGTVVGNIYPKIAKELQKLLVAHDVTEWVPPAAGRLGWVLPDQAAFDAGATDLICIFEPNPTITNSSAGDIRRISTRDTLAGLRLCYDFNAANDGTDYVSCAKAHDEDSLIWISQDVTGHPVKIADWQDADWAPYDAACVEFAKALIGADRSDLIVRADTDASTATVKSRRTIDCVAYPKDKTAKFPAGVIVTGLGKSKIKFVKA